MKIGSLEFQFFFLKKKIDKIQKHLLKNKKDISNKRNFLILLSKLKKIKKYLKKREW
ncbi:30S ribosomal protein S15 [Candidatus Vidania fulgoroideorum]